MNAVLGARYRWLTVGGRVRYVGRQGRLGLRGRVGTVRAVPEYKGHAPKNALVALDAEPGRGVEVIVAPAGCWRAVE